MYFFQGGATNGICIGVPVDNNGLTMADNSYEAQLTDFELYNGAEPVALDPGGGIGTDAQGNVYWSPTVNDMTTNGMWQVICDTNNNGTGDYAMAPCNILVGNQLAFNQLGPINDTAATANLPYGVNASGDPGFTGTMAPFSMDLTGTNPNIGSFVGSDPNTIYIGNNGTNWEYNSGGGVWVGPSYVLNTISVLGTYVRGGGHPNVIVTAANGPDGALAAYGPATPAQVLTEAAAALDAPLVNPTGVATTLRQAITQIWRRFFKTVTLDSSGLLKTYKDDDTTVVTTQNYTNGSQGDAS